MGMKKFWSNSGTQSIHLGRSYTQTSYRKSNYDRSKPVWQILWRKIRREKKKVFSSPSALESSYDQEAYSQNFDQGTGWMEPDNLPRSFSARFADPSRILGHNRLLD
ncbi:Protein kinase, catalytic domain-containing protein [Quillaja saponaria]|uniref:Protein kinase, catalytic domain-containing protein n=1 Tax=Quillaja saponaria TaxID=32244 RepID=A0AAD7LXJ1_QUISA|nr:Protein kinase, catalytic domain-containing protein [Quillaja saponaria]